MRELLIGRELLAEELPTDFLETVNLEELIIESGWVQQNKRYFCRRCGQPVAEMSPSFCTCGKSCGYCRNCIQMGRVKKCSQFYRLKAPIHPSFKPKHSFSWQGTLSEQQALASKEIVTTIKNKTKRLLHAVAGAGKTEMLFPGIYTALQQNERICLASPRVDVCLELAPRLKAAFDQTDIAVLHGDMEESYRYTPLVIATTHQLLRFKEAFDVLIIDEVDAFPFHKDPMLAYAAKKCVKVRHALIYLTATPSKKLRRAFTPKEITTLPARYHGYPLPEPELIFIGDWKEKLLKTRGRPHPLIKKIAALIEKKRHFLIFLPDIAWMLAFEKRLHQLFPVVKFTSVSARDERRKEKITKMRAHDYQFLLTTTILERGVTFPNIDVLIVGAEDRLFDEAALVQIAGRAGRSAQYPTGQVLFYHNGRTRAMNAALRQIKWLNQEARKRGLLNDKVSVVRS